MKKFFFYTLGKKIGLRVSDRIADPRLGKVTIVDDGVKVDLWMDVVLAPTWFSMRRQRLDWERQGYYRCFAEKLISVYVKPCSAGSACAMRLEKCIDNALEGALARVFFALQSELDVLMLHASCVEKDGKAYVFIAPSGGGKTTLSRRMESSGYSVIAEECCPLSFAGGKLLTGPHPSFLGAHKEMLREVAGMYILAKGLNDRIEPMPVNEAISKALPETMVHFFNLVPPDMKVRCRERIFSLLEKAFSMIPFGKFTFVKEGAVEICV